MGATPKKNRQNRYFANRPQPPLSSLSSSSSSSSAWKTSLQRYALAAMLFLLVATTSLRITLYLSNHADDQQNAHQELDVTVPSDLLRHLTPESAWKGGRGGGGGGGTSSALIYGSDTSTTSPPLIRQDDFVYAFDEKHWDSAPVVIEEYKLIFFTVPKVACTTFKQLFRRIMGHENWKSQNPELSLPHDPATNGLRYLWNYTIDEANAMMTSPDYTRAVFVREPKARFLSAFLDKAISNFGKFLKYKCCRKSQNCVSQAQTIQGFLKLIHTCSDAHWDPQAARMESKVWPYINFVGHLETIDQDGPALLKRIGAWDTYGASGWGKEANASIFERATASTQNHGTGSAGKVWQWLNPSLERQIEAYYAADYVHPLLGFRITNLTRDFWIQGQDKIYMRGSWNGAPIVVEEYKLLFFAIPDVGASTWKQALRRMAGLEDWNMEGGPMRLPHDPSHNGLTYLYDYPTEQAEQMIKDPTWIKAVFVQNPKDRFRKIFSFMSKHPQFVRQKCCPQGGCESQVQTPIRMLDLMVRCPNAQWEPQSARMEPKYWKYVNFIGRIETAAQDSKRLLDQIGAWDAIGATGWGSTGEDRIFQSMEHKLDPPPAALEFPYTPVVERLLDDMYKADMTQFQYPAKPTPLQ